METEGSVRPGATTRSGRGSARGRCFCALPLALAAALLAVAVVPGVSATAVVTLEDDSGSIQFGTSADVSVSRVGARTLGVNGGVLAVAVNATSLFVSASDGSGAGSATFNVSAAHNRPTTFNAQTTFNAASAFAANLTAAAGTTATVNGAAVLNGALTVNAASAFTQPIAATTVTAANVTAATVTAATVSPIAGTGGTSGTLTLTGNKVLSGGTTTVSGGAFSATSGAAISGAPLTASAGATVSGAALTATAGAAISGAALTAASGATVSGGVLTATAGATVSGGSGLSVTGTATVSGVLSTASRASFTAGATFTGQAVDFKDYSAYTTKAFVIQKNAYPTSSFTVGPGTLIALPFGTTLVAGGGITVSDSTVFVAPFSGVYQVCGSATWSSVYVSPTYDNQIGFGTSWASDNDAQYITPWNGWTQYQSTCGILYIPAGGSIWMYAWVGSGNPVAYISGNRLRLALTLLTRHDGPTLAELGGNVPHELRLQQLTETLRNAQSQSRAEREAQREAARTADSAGDNASGSAPSPAADALAAVTDELQRARHVLQQVVKEFTALKEQMRTLQSQQRSHMYMR